MFQSTLPRGERPSATASLMMTLEFQSTLPRGERLIAKLDRLARDVVSIHAPAWGATLWILDSSPPISSFNPRSRVGSDAVLVAVHKDWSVSIHAPAWGATRVRVRTPRTRKFQSTLPRGERLCTFSSLLIDTIVSIHAPAWGATVFSGWQTVGRRVSIHAPAWGATYTFYGRTFCRKFQSTLPRGERHTGLYDKVLTAEVSIHAPAWGATTLF